MIIRGMVYYCYTHIPIEYDRYIQTRPWFGGFLGSLHTLEHKEYMISFHTKYVGIYLSIYIYIYTYIYIYIYTHVYNIYIYKYTCVRI